MSGHNHHETQPVGTGLGATRALGLTSAPAGAAAAASAGFIAFRSVGSAGGAGGGLRDDWRAARAVAASSTTSQSTPAICLPARASWLMTRRLAEF